MATTVRSVEFRGVLVASVLAILLAGLAPAAAEGSPADAPPAEARTLERRQAPRFETPLPEPAVSAAADVGAPAGEALAQMVPTPPTTAVPVGFEHPEFEFGYSAVTPPTATQDAVRHAGELWSQLLLVPTGSPAIEVEVDWQNHPGFAVAGGASSMWRNADGSPRGNVWYPDALANSFGGEQVDPAEADIVIEVNQLVDWYTGIDGVVPAAKTDLVTAVMRTIGHGLGFGSSMVNLPGNVSRYGYGTPLEPSIFDVFLEDGSGRPYVDPALPNPGGEMWNRLHNPGRTFTSDHLPGSPEALMTKTFTSGWSAHSPGPAMLGVLVDMGWGALLPAAPTPSNVFAQSLGTTAMLTWSLPPGLDPSGVLGFDIEREGAAGLLHAPPDALTHPVSGLTLGSTYRFRIRARSARGPSAWSGWTAPITAGHASGPSPTGDFATESWAAVDAAPDGAEVAIRQLDGPTSIGSDTFDPGLGRLGLLVAGLGDDLDPVAWSVVAAGAGTAVLGDLRVLDDGDVVVSYVQTGEMTLGAGPSSVTSVVPPGSTTIVVARLAPGGEVLWARQLYQPKTLDASAQYLGVGVDDLFVSTRVFGTVTFGEAPSALTTTQHPDNPSETEPVLVRVSLDDGHFMGAKRLGGAGHAIGRASGDGAGGMFVPISTAAPVSLGGAMIDGPTVLHLNDIDQVQWQRRCESCAVYPLWTGGYLEQGPVPPGGVDVGLGDPLHVDGGPTVSSYLARIGADGTAVWVTPFDGATAQVDSAPGDGVYVGGRGTGATRIGPPARTFARWFEPAGDGFVARLSGASGEVAWMATGGGPGADDVLSLAASTAGVAATVSAAGPAQYGTGGGAVFVPGPAEVGLQFAAGPAPSTAPSAPTAVTAAAGDGSASITWAAPASSGTAVITAYEVAASTGERQFVDPALRSASFGGLSNGVSRTFTVRARNAAGWSPAGSSTPVRHDPTPGVPGLVTARAGNASVIVSWAPPPTGPAINAYEVISSGAAPVTVGGGQMTATVAGVPNGTPVTVQVRARAGALWGPASPAVSAVPTAAPNGPGYHPVPPNRIMDTRRGLGAAGPVLAGAPATLTVTGTAGIPATGVTAVVVNVTAVNASNATHLTVYPTGSAKPTASNLNVLPGTAIANAVTAKVGTGGSVRIANNTGSVDVVVDVVGWYDAGGPATATSGARYVPLTPTRVLDTRKGVGTYAALLGPGASRVVDVTGATGDDVEAVAVNLTAIGPSAATHITLWPSDIARPGVSNLNLAAGATLANHAIVRVAEDGTVALRNNSGTVHLVMDVVGYFSGVGSTFTALPPTRVLDTRKGVGGALAPLGPKGVRVLDVTDTSGSGVPAAGVTAVVLNLTATGASSSTHLTVWPTGETRPGASTLNVAGGGTIPNLVTARVATDGTISIFNNSGTVDVIADVVGWYG